MGRSRTTGWAVGLLVVLVTLTGTACTGGEEPEAAPGTGAVTDLQVRPGARLESLGPVRVDTVAGSLAGKRGRVRDQVAAVVDGWIAAAYLDGPYPRGGFRRAFPDFTQGARSQAQADRLLMSNAGIGTRVEDVVPRRRSIRIDVLAPRGRPRGATARVRLVYATRGEVARRVLVRGRLYLTRTERGWKVFGYDMARGRA
jgi:hypothetical protein